MAYSEDLRERVVNFVRSGGAKAEAARRFEVSRWCIYNWLERECLQASKTGPKQPRRLAPDVLKVHVEQYPDAYQAERAQELGVSEYVIWYGLQRLGMGRKKNASVPRKKRRASQ